MTGEKRDAVERCKAVPTALDYAVQRLLGYHTPSVEESARIGRQARSELTTLRVAANVPTTGGDTSLPQRFYDVTRAFCQVRGEVESAIAEIIGEDVLEEANVEHDSEYDRSVEIVLAAGRTLSAEEYAKIKALGFDRVWCDERSPTGRALRSERKRVAALEADNARLRDVARAALNIGHELLRQEANAKSHGFELAMSADHRVLMEAARASGARGGADHG